MRILIEVSTESEWVARCLDGLGHEVIVADPHLCPMHATRQRKVEADRRGAGALAEACVLRAYLPAHRWSDPQRHVRGRLAVRDARVRRREAVLSLQWQDVDLAHRRVRLRAEHSKNEDPGLIVLKDELLELMEHRHAVRTLCPWVFHRGGRRLMDFRRSWEKACAAAGAPRLLFHDLCRSAIRNMDKAGVSQVVAMQVAGKKTDSVYRRYRIVGEQDIERALDQTQAMLRQARAVPGNVVPMAAR